MMLFGNCFLPAKNLIQHLQNPWSIQIYNVKSPYKIFGGLGFFLTSCAFITPDYESQPFMPTYAYLRLASGVGHRSLSFYSFWTGYLGHIFDRCPFSASRSKINGRFSQLSSKYETFFSHSLFGRDSPLSVVLRCIRFSKLQILSFFCLAKN